jgi:hypothetical protein
MVLCHRRPSIVLDKNILQGSKPESLVEFCRRHVILLPQTLIYEILTEEQEKRGSPGLQSYLEKLRQCRLCVCKSIGQLIAEEKGTHRPAERIVDNEATQRLRAALSDRSYVWPDKDGVLPSNAYEDDFRRVLEFRRARQHQICTSRFSQEVKGITQEARNAGTTVSKMLWDMTNTFVREEWKEAYPLLPRLCTSRSVCFMLFQLMNFIEFRRAADGLGSSMNTKDKALFNEQVDLHYLVLLVQADGIATADGRMREFARVAFPHRRVCETIAEGSA